MSNLSTKVYAAIVLFVGLVAPGVELSIVLLTIAPQLVIGFFAEQWYPAYLTRCTMADVMGQAALFMIPLMVAITVIWVANKSFEISKFKFKISKF